MGYISEYNEASFKMIRLHELQQRINYTKVNPFAIDLETGMINFEVTFKHLRQYFQEIASKLSKTEREGMEKFRDSLEEFMKLFPIIQTRKKIGKKLSKIDIKNWDKFSKYMESFETRLRILADKHGYGTPISSDPAAAMMR